MRPVRVVAPTGMPVSIAEAKAHTIIDADEDDVLVEGLISAAVSHLDGYQGVLGRCMVTQQWRIDLRSWRRCIPLPFPDVASAVVTYADVDGATQTLATSSYELVEGHRGAQILIRPGVDLPSLQDDKAEPVSITFTAGFGAVADVPWALKVAIMQLVAHWYQHREAVGDGSKTPLAFDALIAPYRWMSL